MFVLFSSFFLEKLLVEGELNGGELAFTFFGGGGDRDGDED